jgi:hypothetical protein
MGRHLGIGLIDLWLVEAGFDDSDLGIVRHEQLYAAERCKGSGVGTDPVSQRLGPALAVSSPALIKFEVFPHLEPLRLEDNQWRRRLIGAQRAIVRRPHQMVDCNAILG